jgi:hypothetical protein
VEFTLLPPTHHLYREDFEKPLVTVILFLYRFAFIYCLSLFLSTSCILHLCHIKQLTHLFGCSSLLDSTTAFPPPEEDDDGDDDENPEDLHRFTPLIVSFTSSQALAKSTASSKFTLGNFCLLFPSGVDWDE